MQDTDVIPIELISSCARCGGEHPHIFARKMMRPFEPKEAAPLLWTHWAPCPTNGDPILFMVSSADSDKS